MTRFPTIALFCAFVCAGCGTPHSAAHYTAISDGETVRVTMAEYDSAFRNPLKGFREYFMVGTDARRPEYPYPYGSLIKEYMQWNLLERNAADSVATVIAYSDHRWQGVEEQNVKVIPRVLLVWVEPWHGGWAKDPANRDDLNGWHWPEDLPGETGALQTDSRFGGRLCGAAGLADAHFGRLFRSVVSRPCAKPGSQSWERHGTTTRAWPMSKWVSSESGASTTIPTFRPSSRPTTSRVMSPAVPGFPAWKRTGRRVPRGVP